MKNDQQTYVPDPAVASRLLEWYGREGRDLPWRRTRDPYRIWISEVILQQTRVAQGMSYYHRFLELFPDVAALASAPEDLVLKCWQGLGYYSRARNLLAAARRIVETHGGVFPPAYAAVRALPGVGDYTAAAVCSIVYDGESLKHAFSNKHFRTVTLGQLLENTGMAFFQACIMYYVTSLMGLAETYSVLILAISIAGSLLMYPMVNKFAKKRGKKLPVILGCLVFSVAEIVICFSDKIPGNKLALACVFALFVSFPFAVLNVLPGAMMADIIQYDTVTSGVNQEGIFGATGSRWSSFQCM